MNLLQLSGFYIIGFAIGWLLATYRHHSTIERERQCAENASAQLQNEVTALQALQNQMVQSLQARQPTLHVPTVLNPFNIRCDYCNQRFANGELEFLTSKEADDAAANAGWTVVSRSTSRGVRVCPACIRKGAAQ